MNYIKCGNCLDLLQELPHNSIDCIVTSPPYDNLRAYGGYEFDFEGIAKELYRVMKPNAVMVWVVEIQQLMAPSQVPHLSKHYTLRKLGLIFTIQ